MYHVTVMPCYDKKLEASRQDFYNEQYRTRDVDCVITTGELEILLQERNWDLSAPPVPSKTPMDSFGIPNMVSHQGSSSGSWLQAIMDHIQEREKQNGRDCSVKSKTIRSADYEEVTIEAFAADGPAEVVFRGAKCYGFRNLQNIVRKVAKETGIKGSGAGPGRGKGRVTGAAMALRARRAKDAKQADTTVTATPSVAGEDRPYDYVEVMACPAGCVNGGGQARRPAKLVSELGSESTDTAGMGSRWGDREWVKIVEETYWEQQRLSTSTPTVSKEAVDELASRIEEEMTDSREIFRTQYRAVVSDVVGLNVTW
jgi:iron only hydrogenase large subunit-like protein